MITRFVVFLCLVPFCLTGNLTAAEEHKAEQKKDAKPAEGHGEAKKAEIKPATKPEAPKTETNHEAPPAQEEAPPAQEKKPSAVTTEQAPPRAPLGRRAPSRLAARPRASSPRATAPVSSAAKPAATQAPIVVQVKQEPARVEAILHVVPYGAQSSGVAPFAGSGYTASPYGAAPYTVSTDSAAPVGAPATAEPREPQRETTVADFAPAAYAPPPGVAQSSYAPAIRNSLRTPRNALTNEGLALLAQVGYDEDFILDLMRQKNCHFDTSVEGLAYLATHGLTERIVKAALKADADNRLADSLEARR